jgi:hypothetical protein
MIVSASGKSVGGATVILRAKTAQPKLTWLRHNHDVLARTTSDASGQFSFHRVAIPPQLIHTIEALLAIKQVPNCSPGQMVTAWPGPT